MKISAVFKSSVLSKFAAAALALTMCFGLAACTVNVKVEETEPETSSGTSNPIVNPVVEYGSLEEINEEIGVNLMKPSVDDVSDEKFSVISGRIAQYVCKINGLEWTFRAACVTEEDISGIHSEHNEFVPNQDTTCYTNEFCLTRFFDGTRQYTIAAVDPVSAEGEVRIDEIEFSDICMELESIQKMHMDDPLVGDYQEKANGAIVYVERAGDVYNVSVNWQDSEKFHCWTMYDAVKEDDRLTYRGEEIGVYTYDEEGNETSSDVTMANNIGYFEIKDGALYWTGAAQEACVSWVFEKIVYEE